MVRTLSNLEVAESTAEQIKLLQRAWNASADQVLRRLLDAFMNTEPMPRGEAVHEVRVRCLYEGVWTEGVFEPSSERLLITSGPLKGRQFRSPSGAAAAIVRDLKPGVQPNRNGWTFWTVADSGNLLQTVRQPRSQEQESR
jgi:hypothetical protein